MRYTEVAFVSGAYRAPSVSGIWANIMAAREVAIGLWRRGYVALCPHLNAMLVDGVCGGDDDHVWLQGDLVLLSRCDLIVMMPGWNISSGALSEHEYAFQHGIPVYYWPDVPEMTLNTEEDHATQTSRVG